MANRPDPPEDRAAEAELEWPPREQFELLWLDKAPPPAEVEQQFRVVSVRKFATAQGEQAAGAATLDPQDLALDPIILPPTFAGETVVRAQPVSTTTMTPRPVPRRRFARVAMVVIGLGGVAAGAFIEWRSLSTASPQPQPVAMSLPSRELPAVVTTPPDVQPSTPAPMPPPPAAVDQAPEQTPREVVERPSTKPPTPAATAAPPPVTRGTPAETRSPETRPSATPSPPISRPLPPSEPAETPSGTATGQSQPVTSTETASSTTTPAPALAPEPRVIPQPSPPTPSPSAVPAPARDEAALSGAARTVVEEQHIRAVLSRYQSAYQELDAQAVKGVWPSVDVRALGRAFDGLSSQRVVFDRCEFTIAGPSARAACMGDVSYVMRVGSKEPRTMQRQWTFELHKADDAWVIRSVNTN